MKKIALFISSLFLIAITFYNCSDDNDTVPYAHVDFIVDLNRPEYFSLSNTGGVAMVIGGLNGIVLYRKTYDEFQAFERTCTYDPNGECKRLILNDYTLVDTCCGSEYSVLLDGSVTKGPAGVGLKQYRTRYDENNNRLFVFN